MPGIIGFTKSACLIHNPTQVLKQMQRAITYHRRYLLDTCFEDELLCATRVYLPVIQKQQQPLQQNNIAIWLDGEFYNNDIFTQQPISDPELLLLQYQNQNLHQFLKKIDGIFSAVIYDKNRRTLQLISDRYGLRHLYITINEKGLAWASEIKAFAYLSTLTNRIDPESVATFLNNGYLTGDQTWFKNIKLLEPATIVSWDLTTTATIRYWDWKDIKPIDYIPKYDTIAQQLGELFVKSVARRCNKGERLGIGLSGGLDSRAIFAALPDFCEPVPVVTFGTSNCEDILLARSVAALRPTDHNVLSISADNWLSNRAQGIWLTDGQFNMLHMHGIEQIDQIGSLYDIELNGFLGDALLGGSYARSTAGELATFYNRGRRFIALGLTLGNLAYHTRIPFFDNELIEMTLSIPLHYRKNSLLYNRMLLMLFPAYFSTIPWQKTGFPISATRVQHRLMQLMKKCNGKLSNYLPFLHKKGDYTNYPNWIRENPANNVFKHILFSEKTLITHFVKQSRIKKSFDLHTQGYNQAEILGRYLTFEVWLQQFFNARYRTSFNDD